CMHVFYLLLFSCTFFFFQAEDGIRDRNVTGVQTCALPIYNGSEFLNHGVVGWAGDLGIYFTRGRPYTKNDQATIESKNGHLVRKIGRASCRERGEGSERGGRLETTST